MVLVTTEHTLFSRNAEGLREQLSVVSSADTRLVLPDDVSIVFCGWVKQLPTTRYFIAYDCEQHHRTSITPSYQTQMRKALCIWTFTPLNVAYWKSLGLEAFYVPLWLTLPRSWWCPAPGKEPPWNHLPEHETRMDIVCFGTMTERRSDLEPELRRAGLDARVACFQRDPNLQDRLVRNCRTVLNIKFYTRGSLEVHRLDPLLAQGKCIVSEESTADPDLDLPYREVVTFAPYGKLVDACVDVIRGEGHDDEWRAERGRRGQAWIRTKCADPTLLANAVRATLALLVQK